MTSPMSALTSLTAGPSSLPTTLPPIATKYGLLSVAARKKSSANAANALASAANNALANAEGANAGATNSSPSTGDTSNAAATTGSTAASDQLGNNQTINEQDFMQLLVTQLQNQDPLNTQ